jgi:hypothetical protein
VETTEIWRRTKSIAASQREPLVMGYAMRTRRYRYIEWVPFNSTTTPPTAHWDQVTTSLCRERERERERERDRELSSERVLTRVQV